MEPVPSSFDANAFFLNALKQATPTKSAQIDAEVAQWNIRFTLDETSVTPEFWADVGTGEINVPRRALYRIKAHAYANYAMMDALVRKHQGKGDAELDARLQAASELLTWAVRTDIATALDDGSSFSLGNVPDQFNTLCNKCLTAEQMEIAEEVFRLAVVWILHHEIAHIRLQHVAPPGPDSIREEYEADNAAIDWLVDDAVLSDSERLSHRLAVATGLGWLAAFNVYLGNGTSDTHPPECERFISGIERIAAAGGVESEWSWAVCQAVLLLHAQNAGLPVEPSDMQGSFEEIARRLAQLIEDEA